MKNIRLTSMVETPAVYGPPSDAPSNNKTELKGTNIIIAVLIFVLGVIAILNKKISKKNKDNYYIKFNFTWLNCNYYYKLCFKFINCMNSKRKWNILGIYVEIFFFFFESKSL